MMRFPNQKRITINSDKNNLYAMLNIDSMNTAMCLLKPNTFKLWCYMAKNQNNYTFAGKFCNLSKPTYLKSVQELIDVETGRHGNYDFYERLPLEEELRVTVRK